MNENKFPSKDEFKRKIMRLKKERTLKKEGVYLGYLKEQKMKRKPRKLKRGINKPPKQF